MRRRTALQRPHPQVRPRDPMEDQRPAHETGIRAQDGGRRRDPLSGPDYQEKKQIHTEEDGVPPPHGYYLRILYSVRKT